MRIAILFFGLICYLIIVFFLLKLIINEFNIKKKRIVFCVGYSISCIPLFCILDYIVRGILFVEFMAYIGYLMLGFFIYYVLSLGLILVIKKGIFLLRKSNVFTNRFSIFLASGISILICIYGILAAQMPEFTQQRLDLGLDRSMKITVVSDVHFGATGSFLSLEKMVLNINKTNPDVILFIGDVFDNKVNNLNHSYFVDTLNQLRSRYGVYAVTGNHEFMQNSLQEIQEFYKGTNIHLLLDEEVIINDQLRVVGRIDYRGGRKELGTIISDANLPLIVLDHQPQFYKEAKDLANLQISGHTHNGQIFPGDILIFLLNQIFFQSPSNGIHKYSDFVLAITRGYGTWGFPMRLTGRSQVMEFMID